MRTSEQICLCWLVSVRTRKGQRMIDPKYAGLYGPAQPKRLPNAKQDNQPDEKFLKDWLARTCELVDKYQPEVVWFDWWI